MAEPADKVIAATLKANSTLFMCPSHIRKPAFIRPFSKIGLIEAPDRGLSDPDIVQQLEIVMDVRAPGKRFEDTPIGALHHRQDDLVGARDRHHRIDIIDWLQALVFNARPL
jgi:hypothetical protein